MASNSSQPEEPNKLNESKGNRKVETQIHSEENLEQLAEALNDDLDFWSIDSDLKEIEEPAEEPAEELGELDEFLIPPALPLEKNKALVESSHSQAETTQLDETDIMQRLKEANANQQEVVKQTLSHEDLQDYQDQEHEEIQAAVEQRQLKKSNKIKPTPIENIATLVCILFLIGLGVYCYNYYHNHFEVISDDKWATNLPQEGKYADLKKLDTSWAKPGPGTSAKLGVQLVPTITIKLGENSKSGALRINFFSFEEGLNDNKRAKGDPIPLEFKDGKFLNGKNTISLQCTDGFSSLAQYEEYRNQEKDRWTVTIKEAPSLNTPTSEYLELGHAPIDPIRSEVSAVK